MNDNARGTHVRFGWTLLTIAVLAGALLESLLGWRSSLLGDDELRHRLWSLAHFHAAFLALLNLIYPSAPKSTKTSRSLIAGSVLLPLGFFLGGLAHPEGDPGLGIWLAPLGAAFLAWTGVRRAIE
ncbi:MAG: uncharacterized protein JWO97_908 [Acidobacteria bacterium]|nr:uncharacterized protein [Acidobacteriota bacterium]